VIWIISNVETNIGIIFACVHAARPILSRLLPAFFGEIDRASSENEKLNSITVCTQWSRSSNDTPVSRCSSSTEKDTKWMESSVRYPVVSEKPRAAIYATAKSRTTLGLDMREPSMAESVYYDMGRVCRGTFLDV
jgi:hypothetical protein